MEQMIIANITLDIFSIVLTLIPIVYLLSNKRYQLKINRYFFGVSTSNVFMILADLFDWALKDSLTLNQINILTASSVMFYIASAFVLYFFARYMDEYLKLTGRVRKLYLSSIIFVCSVQVFFAVISPFTDAIFYVTTNGYQRGSLFLISQLVPLFCYLLFTVMVILYRKKLTGREAMSLS